MRHFTTITLCMTAAALGACSTPGVMIVEQFRSPPRWAELAGGPAELRVTAGHLETEGSSAYSVPQRLGDFDLLTDIAFMSEASRGLAGIFARDTQTESDDDFYCLAVRPTGHFRVFKSDEPLDPVGGSGWQELEGRAPAGFLRLGMRRRAAVIEFFVDERRVGEYPVSRSEPSPAETSGGAHELQIGIFSDNVICRWKHFLAADVTAGEDIDLREHLYWGDATTGEILFEECRERLEALLERPSRGRLFGLIAAFDEGRFAFRQAGRPERAGDLVGLLGSERSRLRQAASRCDALACYRSALEATLERNHRGDVVVSPEEQDLVRRADEALLKDQATRALVLYTAAQELREDAARSRRIDELMRRLRPLGFSFTFDKSGTGDLFEEGEIWAVVREAYGALPREDGGELALHVDADSVRYSDTERAKRRVPVRVRDAQLLARREADVRDLAHQMKEDLLDAQARANISQRARAGGAPSSPLREFDIQGNSVKLRVDDGEKLEQLERRLEDARQKLERLKKDRRLEFHSVDATRITYSFSAEVSCRLSLDGRKILEVRREKTYLGLEQWRHPADRERGIEAATPSRHEVEATRDVVVRRALGRLRTAISLENVLGQLPRDQRLDFLLRFARASLQDEHRDRFLWAVRNELEIRGELLRRIGERIIK